MEVMGWLRHDRLIGADPPLVVLQGNAYGQGKKAIREGFGS